ncbi:BolA-like protein isoform 3 [Schistosoma japonicum]|uniref:BolA family protein n=3 Tax=Schistosoma japonicum TaxID=6182 RepID=Q86E09_SCHJA|nr:SJCHGC01317 protein [Schistosoma japonicum]KAH8853891.1 DNA-binding transcriptional regulator BolA [Schistosoma japonicum]KAH8853894.1 DNA-binding transcriptional regulator BolA [Schistosoma japonicum]KAH8853895.1 DNA-binding transcriptional regulator BolA [Schistosoma japonicum]KAH8853896.1 DNA-binding transcriptional regulator BolA [Schistosoma japonicum]
MSFFSFLELSKVVSLMPSIAWRCLSSNVGPVETRMHQLLSRTFKPTFLKIYNESHLHNQKLGRETHFRVVIVSHEFNTISPVKRERLVHKSLEHELQAGVHALSVIARAVDEPLDTHTSPPCQKPVV